MRARRTFILILTVAALGFGHTGEAHAYLDPASGSILLQLILGGVASAGVVAKLYWRRAKERWSSLLRRQS